MADKDPQINLIDQQLQLAAKEMSSVHLRDLLASNGREKFYFQFEDLVVDCTRQPVDEASLKKLLTLADTKFLKQNIEDMFSGQNINVTEKRPVTHFAQRIPERLKDDDFIQLAKFADELRNKKVIKDVVNLGIGGSSLGPSLVTKALAGIHDGPNVHFVDNIDPNALHDVLKKCNPQSTLFILASKSFTTIEMLKNAELAAKWFQENSLSPAQGMVAVTASPFNARQWGVDEGRIFSFDSGVGGRFSLWSAVGLPAMIAVGSDAFASLMAGAYSMDRHLLETPYARNIPIIMGLLRVWHRSYLGRSSYGLMPYDQRLARLPAWVQQLEMESNGKSVDRQGESLDAPAGPLIWGEAGTSCQHSFFQWLHQSVDVVPVDIMVALKSDTVFNDEEWDDSQKILAVNALAQSEALALGFENSTSPHCHFTGNRPSILISWKSTTPYALGRLLALYEHITIVSGFIWNVNSFDQHGVELGKTMAIELGSSSDLSKYTAAAKMFLDRLNNV